SPAARSSTVTGRPVMRHKWSWGMCCRSSAVSRGNTAPTERPALTVAGAAAGRWRAVALLLCLAAGVAPAAEPRPADPELRDKLQDAAAATESFPDRFDGEVWLTDMSRRLARRVPDSAERLEILVSVHREATRAGLPPEMVL